MVLTNGTNPGFPKAEKYEDESLGLSYANDQEFEEIENEYDHDQDEDEDEEGEDNDDDNDGLLSYLFDKSFLKQHAIAILIAFIATAFSYVHIITNPLDPSTREQTVKTETHQYYDTSATFPNTIITRKKKLKPTLVHHHHSYRRTNNLIFCSLDFFTPSESNQERIQRAFQLVNSNNVNNKNEKEEDYGNNHNIDENLELFQFNYPKKYIHLIKQYIIADDIMDDDGYNETIFNHDHKGTATSEDHINYQCLLDSMVRNDQKDTIPMHTVAYQYPSIDTYYHNIDDENVKSKIDDLTLNQGLAVLTMGLDKLNDENNNKNNIIKRDKIKQADLSYTGFTAKFTNLSQKEVRLFWDSRTKPKFVSTIQPFESFTTVTFPGNSFHVTPTYDTSNALQRWTVTSDESVLYFDPFEVNKKSDVDKEEKIGKMPFGDRTKYEMHQLNKKYAREYLAVTQRAWLSMFPRPMHMHYMWDAKYFGQVHSVSSKQTHFVDKESGRTSSSVNEELWKKLDYEDYDNMVDEKNLGNENAFVQLPQHREGESLELKLKALSITPKVFEIQNFLSLMEVEHLLQLAKTYNVTSADHKQALKGNQSDLTKDERKKRKQILSSARSNAWLRREYSPIVNSIYHRVADVLQIDEALLRHRNEHEHTELNTHHSIAEAIHIVEYGDGQGYSPRLDGSQPSLRNRYQPNRFATVIFFLSDMEGAGDGNDTDISGGELNFPLAITAENHDGITIRPKVGNAVMFYNMLPDGNIDDLSQHASKVIEKGSKWMGTLFVWDPIID